MNTKKLYLVVVAALGTIELLKLGIATGSAWWATYKFKKMMEE